MVTESTSPAVSVLCTCRLLFSSRLHGTTRWSSGLGAAFFTVVFCGSCIFASVRAFLERIIIWPNDEDSGLGTSSANFGRAVTP